MSDQELLCYLVWIAPNGEGSIPAGGNSGGSLHTEDWIYGYTELGIQKHHVPRLENLVAPEFRKEVKTRRQFTSCMCREVAGPWGERIVQAFCPWAAIDVKELLASSKIPPLVINREYDSSLKARQEAAQKISGATHKVLPKTGHASCKENPAGFHAFVVEFLTSQSLLPLQETEWSAADSLEDYQCKI